MTSLKRHLWIAAVTGTTVFGIVYALSFAINPDHHPALTKFLFTALFPGFFATVVLFGIHNASAANYIEIGVPTNTVLYATIVFIALRLSSLRGDKAR